MILATTMTIFINITFLFCNHCITSKLELLSDPIATNLVQINKTIMYIPNTFIDA